ncbi:MAG: inositol monophosphatase [SAR202 cluster bacterium]|nr:inositol monophosphatase [SAR202 cluster bacterium]|tara:strand:+ start:1974 stop:2735 length:762 start_codon:yes stop_codon:yes gene_type:complete
MYNAATRAGDTLIERFKEDKYISFKGRADVVTDVDIDVERQIIAYLQSEYVGFGIHAEESQPIQGNSGYTWVIDPLDGTRNYSLGIPFFSVVIALCREGEVIMGVTYDPIRKEMFHAVKGQGAFLNDEAINVSEKNNLQDALLGYDLGYVDADASKAIELILSLWPNIQGTRILGSAALGIAYASCGRLDLYFHHRLSPWDLASGILIAREANGIVTDKYSVDASLDSESIIVSNQGLHRNFIRATEGLAWRT